MHLKFLEAGVIIAKGNIKRNNGYERVDKIFFSEKEFWDYLLN